MEDDDEFGDLYTDVLQPFSTSSSSAAPQPHKPSPTPQPIHRPIDLNIQSDGDEIPNPPSSNLQTLVPSAPDSNQKDHPSSAAAAAAVVDARVFDDDAKLPNRTSNDDVKEEVNFDIEEEAAAADTGIDDLTAEEPIIPGLSNPERKDDVISGGGGGGGDDWESDSEDDLQIVLNDNNHGGAMGMMERGGGGAMDGGDDDDDDDDDEDGDPLVIVTDGDPNQVMGEEQEWGEDAGQAADGERKEGGEVMGKPNGGAGGVGGIVIAPKIGYSNHGYHPFHSQFKYVRPGAAPIPGATTIGPGGVPGQVRPLVNMGPMPGRGRGDWRPTGIKGAPPMQKGFHSGFGMPGWGNNMAGRGFGGGLEFTLPSHKTIFDVDIDSFEEKPWKYPGVDISHFFNFGLNEESWKDYCKQLEQHRLETTMQSKIRVYESGRTEQEFDPDLPPELAAAAGFQDVPADNANFGKSDVGQSDLTKGSARVRPPLPTGRAIQVEGGCGERLPSIDTRPPRIRDLDAIIEIVLQDSVDDDSSTGNGVQDPPREDDRGDHITEDDVAPIDTEHSDGFPEAYNSRRTELGGRRTPFMNSVHDDIPEGDGVLPFPPEAPLEYHPGSREQSLVYPRGNFGAPHDERRTQGRARDRSPHPTPSRGKQDKKFLDNQEEESFESMDGKHSPPLSSPVTVKDARELSVEHKDAVHEELVLVDGSFEVDKEEMTTNDTPKDENLLHSLKKQKISSQVEQPVLQELDDEDSKAARSSENSKARSGSSRDCQKWQDGVEEEVVQDGRSSRMGSTRKHLDEIEQNFRRKDRDGRQEMERNRMVMKGRDDSFPYRDLDPSLAHHLHMKTEGFDRRKERVNPDVAWQRRDDDPYSRKSRTEDTRKRERADDMGSRHKGKLRESERSDKDEHVYSRKQLDNGSYRVQYEKDVGSRHREKDDNLKSRYEIVDDYHSKRRKDEEYSRSDHAEKEEILHGHRETSSRRKRERDDVLDLRKRDDQQRIRDNLDDHHSVRYKDEPWLTRERNERQREREDWHRLKQSHEETLPKREREEGRVAVRSGRGSEDKAWVGHARAKDEYKGSDKEYQLKDTARHSEQLKRRDRAEDESSSHHRGREDVYTRGNQFSNEERKSRQERSSARNDRAVTASDNQRVLEKRHKESTRKNKESEGGDNNTLASSKRNQDDQSGHINEMGLKGASEQGNGENKIPVHRNSSRKHREEASSDDEQPDSRRGRSKLERWTSHKERDYSINSKSSASLKFKEIDRNNNGGSTETSKLPDAPAKTMEAVDNQHTLAEENDATDPEIKDADAKPLEERHLDTVEKLKKRSERFKLPMPSEKDAFAVKKMESEPLPSAKSETPADSEIKQERPARKRRWISN